MAYDKALGLLLLGVGTYAIVSGAGSKKEEEQSAFTSGSGQGRDFAFILPEQSRGYGALGNVGTETTQQQLPNVIINESSDSQPVFFIPDGMTKKEVSSSGGTTSPYPSGSQGGIFNPSGEQIGSSGTGSYISTPSPTAPKKQSIPLPLRIITAPQRFPSPVRTILRRIFRR